MTTRSSAGLDIGAAVDDAQRMRTGGAELLSLALMDARNHTLRVFAAWEEALAAGGFAVPLLPEVNPPLWELGHVGWFQEWWIGRNMQRQRGSGCDPLAPKLASIEPRADAWYHSGEVAHDTRWSLALPDVEATRQYLLATLDTTLELLDGARRGDESDAALYFYRLALFHEDMHAEAFTYMAQTLGFGHRAFAAWLPEPASLAPREPLLFPATRWTMGSAGAGFAFDNELAAHEVAVPEFEIDALPVSWGQYVEFVEDGGYDEPRWWSPGGRAWLETHADRRAPRHVEQLRGAVLAQRFGRAVRVPLPQPVMHVSAHEAEAWCRWAGRRLPTEVEWEVAAVRGASRGFRWGDVWEWTGGAFQPYPGFAPHPYRDYSLPWFGTHRAVRGASFATRGRMKHPRYRNFYRPDRDDLFVGFRSCAL